jgi:hypothetical protein
MVASWYKVVVGWPAIPVCRKRRGDGFFCSSVREKEEKFKTDTEAKLPFVSPAGNSWGMRIFLLFSRKHGNFYQTRTTLRATPTTSLSHSSSIKLRKKNWHQQPRHLALQTNEDAIPFLSLSRISEGQRLPSGCLDIVGQHAATTIYV